MIDPEQSGDPAWVAYHAQFYERRVAVPAAAEAIEPVAGERAILTVSIAGYVAADPRDLRAAAAALQPARRRPRCAWPSSSYRR